MRSYFNASRWRRALQIALGVRHALLHISAKGRALQGLLFSAAADGGAGSRRLRAPHSEHFRTVGFDTTMNSAYRHLNSFVCFPPLVIAKNARSRSIDPDQYRGLLRGGGVPAGRRFGEGKSPGGGAGMLRSGARGRCRSCSGAQQSRMVLHRLKRLDEALLCFDRMLALNRHVAETHFNRGAMLQELNRRTEALSSYDLMLALKPDFVPALNNRALVLWHMKMYDAALASCDRALAVKPDDQSARATANSYCRTCKGALRGADKLPSAKVRHKRTRFAQSAARALTSPASSPACTASAATAGR